MYRARCTRGPVWLPWRAGQCDPAIRGHLRLREQGRDLHPPEVELALRGRCVTACQGPTRRRPGRHSAWGTGRGRRSGTRGARLPRATCRTRPSRTEHSHRSCPRQPDYAARRPLKDVDGGQPSDAQTLALSLKLRCLPESTGLVSAPHHARGITESEGHGEAPSRIRIDPRGDLDERHVVRIRAGWEYRPSFYPY